LVFDFVDKAVRAAKMAFHKAGEWHEMNPRDRGALSHKLADLMEREQERVGNT
jgi:acyl-CoA reductase-like NAD-dependent aldehyde dehydrogenase